MPEVLDPLPLLRFLHERGVEYIVIGGVAVSAHGFVRPSKDLDIVPKPECREPQPACRGTEGAEREAMKQAAGRPRDLDDLQHLPDVEDAEAQVRRHEAAKGTGGLLTGAYPPGYFKRLREDWPS
jgi:hypothetical protein